jgi:hypothetical protein
MSNFRVHKGGLIQLGLDSGSLATYSDEPCRELRVRDERVFVVGDLAVDVDRAGDDHRGVVLLGCRRAWFGVGYESEVHRLSVGD